MAGRQIDIVDAQGAAKAYLTAFPGLCGVGNPIRNGVHIADIRSSSNGVYGIIRLIAPRTPDDIVDTARLSCEIRAVGSEHAVHEVAEFAARRLAAAWAALETGEEVTVTTRRGEQVKLISSSNIQGPTQSGAGGGQVSYLVDVTVIAQPG